MILVMSIVVEVRSIFMSLALIPMMVIMQFPREVASRSVGEKTFSFTLVINRGVGFN